MLGVKCWFLLFLALDIENYVNFSILFKSNINRQTQTCGKMLDSMECILNFFWKNNEHIAMKNHQKRHSTIFSSSVATPSSIWLHILCDLHCFLLLLIKAFDNCPLLFSIFLIIYYLNEIWISFLLFFVNEKKFLWFKNLCEVILLTMKM